MGLNKNDEELKALGSLNAEYSEDAADRDLTGKFTLYNPSCRYGERSFK